jgi:hypothetical protein
MSDKEWLQSLKPGDEVAVESGGPYSSYTFRKITKVTATQIIFHISGDYFKRFSRETGREKGASSYRADHLKPSTPELKAEIARTQRYREMTARLDRVRWQNYSHETLEQIVALLDKPEEDQGVTDALQEETNGPANG